MTNTSKLVEIDHVREKLIELVGQVQDCGCDVTDVVVMNYVENNVLIDHLIANGVTVTDTNVGKWISVKDRLPETFGEYIVAVQSWEEEPGNLYTDYADYDPYVKQWKTGLYLCERDSITHWMPLPEPPKGE